MRIRLCIALALVALAMAGRERISGEIPPGLTPIAPPPALRAPIVLVGAPDNTAPPMETLPFDLNSFSTERQAAEERNRLRLAF